MMSGDPIRNRLLALMLAFLFAISAGSALAEGAAAPGSSAYDPDHPENLVAGNLDGASCLVMDRVSGDVLFQKDAAAKRYPASTTKIMTLLLACEYGNLDEVIEIPTEAKKIPSDSSQVPVVPGERMPFESLLYGLMLSSGNDAANAVAVIVSGSLDAFVARMNERAKELGCTGTNFVNAHGYHNENHYTTAMDLAKIAAEGMKHEAFRMIVSSPYYTLPATLYRAQGLEIENHNKMLFGSSPFYYAPIIGIKTGFHSQSGQCFVGAAARDGVNLVSVTLKTTNDGRWTDTKKLVEYGFAQFDKISFAELFAEHPVQVAVQGADPDDPQGGKLALQLDPAGSLNGYTMVIRPEDGAARLNQIIQNSELTYTHMLVAPIAQGDPVATITAKYADGTALSATLLASRDVAAAPPATIEESSERPQAESVRATNLDVGFIRLLVVVIGALLVLLAALIFIVRIKRKRARERERRRRAALKKRRAAQRRQV